MLDIRYAVRSTVVFIRPFVGYREMVSDIDRWEYFLEGLNAWTRKINTGEIERGISTRIYFVHSLK